MKRFHFPLRSVATLRVWREREAREAFGAAVRALTLAQGQLDQARERAAVLEQQVRDGRQVTFRPGEQSAFLAAHDSAQQAVRAAETAVAETSAARDQARSRWASTRSDRRAIEQVETRARQLHRLEEDRAEQVALDEIASLRAFRNAASP